MKELQLTNADKKAIVDDEDHERLSKFRWLWRWSRSGDCILRESGKNKKYYSETGVFLISKREHIRVSIANEVMQDYSPQIYDHIDRNPFNNQKQNLRKATTQQNNHNLSKQKFCSSKYKGVCFHSSHRKWQAYITINYKKIYLGIFQTEAEAALAYNEKAKELHKEFAALNVVEDENENGNGKE